MGVRAIKNAPVRAYRLIRRWQLCDLLAQIALCARPASIGCVFSAHASAARGWLAQLERGLPDPSAPSQHPHCTWTRRHPLERSGSDSTTTVPAARVCCRRCRCCCSCCSCCCSFCWATTVSPCTSRRCVTSTLGYPKAPPQSGHTWSRRFSCTARTCTSRLCSWEKVLAQCAQAKGRSCRCTLRTCRRRTLSRPKTLSQCGQGRSRRRSCTSRRAGRGQAPRRSPWRRGGSRSAAAAATRARRGCAC